VEIKARERSIAEFRSDKNKLIWSLVLSMIVITLLAIKLCTQSEIIINQTPGMPDHTVIEKTAMDKRAQQATLSAVTAAIAQVNPANYQYVKPMIQVYLAPALYTKVSADIDAKVQQLILQHELGSYYFVQKSYEYDPQLDRHFIVGDVHTVNAAKDTAAATVFEYAMHVENYRAVIDDAQSYPGEQPHDSQWRKAHKS
jgi:conjugal transfer pilus assembly protein TraE